VSTPTCPNCGVVLPEAEVNDGWCETCGKRLPTSITSHHSGRAAGRQPRSRFAPPAKTSASGWVLILTGCVLVGGAAMVAGALLGARGVGLAFWGGLAGGLGAGLGRALARATGRWPKDEG